MVFADDEIGYDVADGFPQPVVEIQIGFPVVGRVSHEARRLASEFRIPTEPYRTFRSRSFRKDVFVDLEGFRSSGDDEFAGGARAVRRREAEWEFLICRGRGGRISFKGRSR